MTSIRRVGRHATVLRTLLGLAGAWAMAVTALAQTPTGTILGTVKDASGGAVPGAGVDPRVAFDARFTSVGRTGSSCSNRSFSSLGDFVGKAGRPVSIS